MLGRFNSYLTEYKHIFKSKTKRFFPQAQLYCQGVFMSELTNMERISEEMFAGYRQMQHFITESPMVSGQINTCRNLSLRTGKDWKFAIRPKAK